LSTVVPREIPKAGSMDRKRRLDLGDIGKPAVTAETGGECLN
jgi:hypothetical protein